MNAGFCAAFWAVDSEWYCSAHKSGATALRALEPVIERWNECFQTWILLCREAARNEEACECQL